MKRTAAVFPVALLLISLGCGDDAPSSAKDPGASTTDGAVTPRRDGGGSTSGETRSDAGAPKSDAGSESTDADSPVEPGPQTDAAVAPMGDSGITVLEGDSGTDWILGQQCPASTESDLCYACEDEKCCEAYARYKANPEAAAFWGCLDDCTESPGASCEEKCHDEHPEGTADVAARTSCLALYCLGPDECGNKPLTTCAACTAAKCASELVAARGTEGGYLLQACNKSCKGSAACEQSCVEKHSTGAGWVLRAGECAKTNCAAECKD